MASAAEVGVSKRQVRAEEAGMSKRGWTKAEGVGGGGCSVHTELFNESNYTAFKVCLM